MVSLKQKWSMFTLLKFKKIGIGKDRCRTHIISQIEFIEKQRQFFHSSKTFHNILVLYISSSSMSGFTYQRNMSKRMHNPFPLVSVVTGQKNKFNNFFD